MFGNDRELRAAMGYTAPNPNYYQPLSRAHNSSLLLQPPPPPPPPFDSRAHGPAVWTPEENRAFEEALVCVEEQDPNRWYRIAERIPGKTPQDAIDHYGRLVQDLMNIDAGIIPLPAYADDEPAPSSDCSGSGGSQKQHGRRMEERKKGVPWTEDEHKKFLEGLQTYGKGDWRSISRNSVVTRTPTQVASHAQKFFLRLNNIEAKEKKRTSIHDITQP